MGVATERRKRLGEVVRRPQEMEATTGTGRRDALRIAEPSMHVRVDQMKRNVLALVAITGLSACQPAAAPVPEAAAAPVVETAGPYDGRRA